MTVNYPTWQIAFNLIQLLLTLAVWWSSRNKVTNDRFTQLENSKLKLELDLAHVRKELDKRPAVCTNHQRMESNDKDLFVRLDSLHGDIRELVGGVKGLTNSLELINQHLLNGGK